ATVDEGYETAIALLPIAGSQAGNRHFTVVPAPINNGGTFAQGKTYTEILQRMLNSVAWRQNDANAGVGAGGWIYSFNSSQSDGSTVGWDMLGIFDAVNAGATLPPWVKTQFSAPGHALVSGLNSDGSFDYRADGNVASDGNVNVAK